MCVGGAAHLASWAPTAMIYKHGIFKSELDIEVEIGLFIWSMSSKILLHRSKLKLTAFLDVCTSVLSLFASQEGKLGRFFEE